MKSYNIIKIKFFRVLLWIFFTAIIVIAVLYLTMSSHRTFKDTITSNFNSQQSVLVRFLGDIFFDHVSKADQNLNYIARQIEKDGNTSNASKYMSMVYSMSDDDFISISLHRENAQLIYNTPSDNKIDANYSQFVANYIIKNKNITKSFLSKRYRNDQGQNLIILFKPFTISNIKYYVVGSLDIEKYSELHLNTWEASDLSYFISDSDGNIFGILNVDCEDSELMKSGNLFLLDDECLSCHLPNEFDVLKQSLDEQDVTYSIQEYPSKGSVNRTAYSIPLFNEKWIVCLGSPYEKIQGAVEKNARQSMMFAILGVIAIGIVGAFVYRIKKRNAVVEVADALIQSEKKFRTIIENIEDGYFEVDLAGNFTFFNESLRKQLGYSNEELMGMNNRDYMNEENSNQVFMEFNKIYKTGEPTIITWEFIRKNGEKRFAESAISLIRGSKGKPIGFRGIVRDETERMQAERAIGIEKAYLAELIESTPLAIAVLDKQSNVQRINKEFTNLFGYGEEVLGQNIDNLLTNEELREEAEKISATSLIGKRVEKESVRIRKDGTPVDVSIIGTPVKFEDGHPAIFGIYRDISEQKRDENIRTVLYEIARAVSTSKDMQSMYRLIHESLSKIIDTSNFYIAYYDHNIDLITFPYYIDEVDDNTEPIKPGKGLTGYILKSKESLFLSKHDILKLIKSGKVDQIGTPSEQWLGVPLLFGDQAVGAVVVQSYTAPNLYSEKDIKVLEFVSSNITDAMTYRLTQDSLQESEKRYRVLSENLEKSNSMKELLLDVITHDLKNPAGVIQGMTEMMIEELPENEMVEAVKNSSDTLLEVIDNATVLSQVAFGDEIKKTDTNLAEVIQEIAKEWKSILNNAGMTMETDFPSRLSIMANPIISEVFKNYISNAVKYANKGKKILITSEEVEGSITINVKDFGETLPEDKRKAVFIRSVQLEEGEKRGRGLGLAIVKRIAEAHNAEVGVKPNKPTGNIFYITFPTE